MMLICCIILRGKNHPPEDENPAHFQWSEQELDE